MYNAQMYTTLHADNNYSPKAYSKRSVLGLACGVLSGLFSCSLPQCLS